MRKQDFLGNRIASMFIDCFYMFILCGASGSLICLLVFLYQSKPKNAYEFHIFGGAPYYILLGAFYTYTFKDSINGRSLGKRITNMQVVDNKTGKSASPLQCLIRNLFILIAPVEFILSFVNPYLRIGDRAANTKVVFVIRPIAAPITNYAPMRRWIFIFKTLALALFTCITRQLLTAEDRIEAPKYVQSSHNAGESQKITKLLSDNLDTNISIKVMFFDSVENSKLKYLSVVCEEHFVTSDSVGSAVIDSKVLNLINKELPKGSFIGQVKYHENGDISIHNIK